MESVPLHPVAKPASRGFTLVEMMVVLAIIAVITGIVINGQSTYNQTLILTDTAYTVAFSVRQAQSLGLSSRTSGGISNAGYGVRFESPTSYTSFADTGGSVTVSDAWCPRGIAGTPEAKPGNCRFDPGETIQTYTFGRGFTVSDFCGKLSNGTRHCVSTGQISSLDVVFMRPETRAVLTGSNGVSYTCAEAVIAAPTGGASRIVRISQLGEISVGQLQCP
jgi:prepilin-type N-terminal cleavage/methylation domain-containing protein